MIAFVILSLATSENYCFWNSNTQEKLIWAHYGHLPKAKRIWIDGCRARALLSTHETHLGRRAQSESTFEHTEEAFGSTGVEREQIWTYNKNKREPIGNTIRSTSVERKRFWTYRRRAWGSTNGAFRSTCVKRTRFTYKSRIVFCHWKMCFARQEPSEMRKLLKS